MSGSEKVEQSECRRFVLIAAHLYLPWHLKIPRKSVCVSECSDNEISLRRPFKSGHGLLSPGSTHLAPSRDAKSKKPLTLGKASCIAAVSSK